MEGGLGSRPKTIMCRVAIDNWTFVSSDSDHRRRLEYLFCANKIGIQYLTFLKYAVFALFLEYYCNGFVEAWHFAIDCPF